MLRRCGESVLNAVAYVVLRTESFLGIEPSNPRLRLESRNPRRARIALEEKDDPQQEENQQAPTLAPSDLPNALPDLRSDKLAWKNLQLLLYPSADNGVVDEIKTLLTDLIKPEQADSKCMEDIFQEKFDVNRLLLMSMEKKEVFKRIAGIESQLEFFNYMRFWNGLSKTRSQQGRLDIVEERFTNFVRKEIKNRLEEMGLYPWPVADATDIDEALLCPLTHSLMYDPVSTSDGQVYEREAITQWFSQGHQTSPLTNLELPNLTLTSNEEYQSRIRQLLESRPDLAKLQYLPAGWIQEMKEACFNGDTVAIRELVQKDKRLLLTQHEGTKTFPLHCAALHIDSLTTVIELLESRQRGLALANLLCPDSIGRLPLEYAIQYNGGREEKDDPALSALIIYMGNALVSVRLSRPIPYNLSAHFSIGLYFIFENQVKIMAQKNMAYNPRLFSPQQIIHPPGLGLGLALFLHVVAHKQVELAENMLKRDRQLALKSSGRSAIDPNDPIASTFCCDITGFQHAIFDGNMPMCLMISNYLSKEELDLHIRVLQQNKLLPRDFVIRALDNYHKFFPKKNEQTCRLL
ncbi:MAG: hypothetical protein K0R24_860 [Gammaproteobacteria bacterium]|jgi:hypothetical protein|nr:hypothetical protein [Gammaproteobacteria bacterium]